MNRDLQVGNARAFVDYLTTADPEFSALRIKQRRIQDLINSFYDADEKEIENRVAMTATSSPGDLRQDLMAARYSKRIQQVHQEAESWPPVSLD